MDDCSGQAVPVVEEKGGDGGEEGKGLVWGRLLGFGWVGGWVDGGGCLGLGGWVGWLVGWVERRWVVGKGGSYIHTSPSSSSRRRAAASTPWLA